MEGGREGNRDCEETKDLHQVSELTSIQYAQVSALALYLGSLSGPYIFILKQKQTTKSKTSKIKPFFSPEFLRGLSSLKPKDPGLRSMGGGGKDEGE